MGCCSSSNTAPATDKDRRRLSIGQPGVEAQEDDNDMPGCEQDRGLLTRLNESNVIELLEQQQVTGGEGRKFSIGSLTDNEKTSFANKTMQQIGQELDPAACGLGYTCRKGLKPDSPNQDSWSIVDVHGDFSIYGVYDGHGQRGHDVSDFVRENLPKLLIQDKRFRTTDQTGLCVDNFKKMQSLIQMMDAAEKLQAQMSGTTATVVMQDHAAGKLTISHVADSTAVLGQYEDASKQHVKAVTLTRDHKPNIKSERARIEKAGGRVVFDGYANHRVYAKNGRYPGLNMSRCLGDLVGHADAGCSCEPDVSERRLTPLDHVLLLCSDGVWEFITAQEAVELVCQFDASRAMIAAERLAKWAWDRWIQEEGGAVVDDITVVLVYLNPGSNNNSGEEASPA